MQMTGERQSLSFILKEQDIMLSEQLFFPALLASQTLDQHSRQINVLYLLIKLH